MVKITCPQCSAVNQDVEPNDPCWKCGTSLGQATEPVAAAPKETIEPTPVMVDKPVVTRPKIEPTPQITPVPPQPIQKQVPAKSPPSVGIIVLIIFVVAALLGLLLLFLLNYKPGG